MRSVDSSGSNSNAHMGVKDWRFYDEVNFGGDAEPTNMSANSTVGSPYVASAGKVFNSTYDPYKAFDSNLNSWYWTLTASAANSCCKLIWVAAQQRLRAHESSFTEAQAPHTLQ